MTSKIDRVRVIVTSFSFFVYPSENNDLAWEANEAGCEEKL